MVDGNSSGNSSNGSDSAFRWAQLALTTIVGGLLTWGGSIYLERMKTQIENAKIAQADREFTVSQKDAEVELTTKMFGMLMQRYLGQDTTRNRLLTLRLLALNFADVPINLRPMFEDLEQQAPAGKARDQLRAIAREVARRQAFRLTARDGSLQEFKDLAKGGEGPIQDTPFGLHVNNVSDDAVVVELIEGGHKIGPFRVTYYDWPLVDNTKFGNERLAVMLLASKDGKAALRVIRFPSILAPDRFDIKEIGISRERPPS